MKLSPITVLIGMVVTFIVVFLMNYLGNDEADKMYRASLNAFAGAVGSGIGLWFMGRQMKNEKNDNNKNPDFD